MPEYTTLKNPDGKWVIYQDGLPLEVCDTEADAQAYIEELIEADES